MYHITLSVFSQGRGAINSYHRIKASMLATKTGDKALLRNPFIPRGYPYALNEKTLKKLQPALEYFTALGDKETGPRAAAAMARSSTHHVCEEICGAEVRGVKLGQDPDRSNTARIPITTARTGLHITNISTSSAQRTSNSFQRLAKPPRPVVTVTSSR